MCIYTHALHGVLTFMLSGSLRRLCSFERHAGMDPLVHPSKDSHDEPFDAPCLEQCAFPQFLLTVRYA